MISIGIIGEKDAGHVIDIIRRMYRDEETARVFVQSIETATKGDLSSAFEILVVGGRCNLAEPFLKRMRRTDFLILNADSKDLFGCLHGSAGKLITYGFSGKACVTASSVDDESGKAVQLCIQRPLPTITGDVIEQQEFSVRLQDAGRSTYCILSAVTAALVAGLSVETVSQAMF